MKKVLGLALLLLAIAVVTTLLTWDESSGGYTFVSAYNLENLLQRVGMFGVLSLAAAFVIVTGGIDLSIGAVVCVAACVLPWLTKDLGWNGWVAFAATLALCAAIGVWHGVLVVGLGIQPFVVTLCGLLVYRGAMRSFTGDETMGFGRTGEELRWLATGKLPLGESFGVPVPFVILALVATVTWLLWTRTVWGRHLFALGRNEQAARFAGVATGRLTLLAYVACAALAGLGGCLFQLDVNSASASSFGTFYELYAIAGAVLGGVALRGGEGIVLGVVLGASLMQVLPNMIRLAFDSDRLEFVVVGGVILLGVVADAALQRWFGRRART